MSEEIEKLSKPQKKKTVRYFGEVNKIESEDVEHIKVDNKKKPNSFDGEVIQVQEKAKFYAKSKWNNKRPENPRKFNKPKKGLVKIEVDPYARDRHTRKYLIKSCTNVFHFVNSLSLMFSLQLLFFRW